MALANSRFAILVMMAFNSVLENLHSCRFLQISYDSGGEITNIRRFIKGIRIPAFTEHVFLILLK
jgi:hypothetical protein